jgi:hypothetical protein
MTLYEINITVDLIKGKDHMKWSLFCRDNNFNKKEIYIYNDSVKCSKRYIISKWCRRDTVEDIKNYVQEIIGKIQSQEFQIIRTQVCSVWNKLDTHKPLYHEYMFNINIRRSGNFDKLCEIFSDYDKVSIESINDLVRVRIRGKFENKQDAENHKNGVINYLKAYDLHVNGRILEHGVYFDTNEELDLHRF